MNLDEIKPEDLPELPGFITRFSWLDMTLTAAMLVLAIGLTEWAHWNAVVAFAVAFGGAFLGSFAARAVRDMRPRPVPANIADAMAKLEAAGFRRPRLHPWLCDMEKPHAHLIAPEGGGMVRVSHADDDEMAAAGGDQP